MSELWDFVLTGTGVYGPQTPGKSDIDIVLDWRDATKLEQELRAYNIEMIHPETWEAYRTGSFYFNIGGLKFNIIVSLHDDEFKDWREKTERMKKIDPIEDRAKRLRAFNGKEATNETK